MFYRGFGILGSAAWWRILAVAASVLAFAFASQAKRWLQYTLAFLPLVLSIFVVLALTYYRYFGGFPNLSLFALSGQAGSVASYVPYLLKGDQILVLTAGLVGSLIWMRIRFIRIRKLGSATCALIASVLFILPWLHVVIANKRTKVDHDYAVDRVGFAYYFDPRDGLRRFGYLPYLFYQRRFTRTRVRYDNPEPVHDEPSHELYGRYRGKNVIIVQVESLGAELVGRKANGFEVTPFCNILRENSIYCDRFYAIHGAGGSSDAEYPAITGLLPMTQCPTFNVLSISHVPSLAKTLGKEGYASVGFHGNVGTYWNRSNAYRQLGFNQFVDQEGFKGNARGFGSQDHLFFAQTAAYLDKLNRRGRPFFAYLITQSLHGPHRNVVKHKGVDFAIKDNEVDRFFNMARYVDFALKGFIDQLKERGIFDRSIIVIYGDHTTAKKSPEYNSLSDQGERIPLFIITPDRMRKRIADYGSHLDIGPTIADLLGVTLDPRWIGQSLLRWHPDKRLPFRMKQPPQLIGPDGPVPMSALTTREHQRVAAYCQQYFWPRQVPEQKQNPLWQVRSVAHAGGQIDGISYTNSREALESNYKRGARYFELDFCGTADGQLVAFHDGLEADLGLDRTVQKVTKTEIQKRKLHGKYAVLDLQDVYDFLIQHPDSVLITDTKVPTFQGLHYIAETVKRRDPGLLKRIIPQFYHPEELDELKKLKAFDRYIFTLYRTRLSEADVFSFVDANREVQAVTVPKPHFSEPLARELAKIGVPLFVHTVNDPEEIARLRCKGAAGVYTDCPVDAVWGE